MHERHKDEIRYHIDATLRAYIDQDWTSAGQGYVPNWCGFTINTRAILHSASALVAEIETLSEHVKLIDYEMVEIDYVFRGAACLVPYVARLRGRWDAGGLFEIKVQALSVYLHIDGTWQQVAGNISLHPDAISDPRTRTLLSRLVHSA
ncbi:MAG: hypothetical protein PVH11_13510 [Anaerolineae bacterium]|jgi:hypothetical protein